MASGADVDILGNVVRCTSPTGLNELANWIDQIFTEMVAKAPG